MNLRPRAAEILTKGPVTDYARTNEPHTARTEAAGGASVCTARPSDALRIPRL